MKKLLTVILAFLLVGVHLWHAQEAIKVGIVMGLWDLELLSALQLNGIKLATEEISQAGGFGKTN